LVSVLLPNSLKPYLCVLMVLQEFLIHSNKLGSLHPAGN
jgi:hypothetical protein